MVSKKALILSLFLSMPIYAMEKLDRRETVASLKDLCIKKVLSLTQDFPLTSLNSEFVDHLIPHIKADFRFRLVGLLPGASLKVFSDYFAWHPDGNSLQTSGESDLRLTKFSGHTASSEDVTIHHDDYGNITAGAWSPDGQCALTSSAENLRLWDCSTKSSIEIFRYDGDFSDGALDIKWNAAGTHAFIIPFIGPFLLFDLTNKQAPTHTEHEDGDEPGAEDENQGSLKAAWNPIEDYILSAYEYQNALKLWDMRDKKHCTFIKLEGHTEAINQFAWCPDGSCALSASKDKTLRLWALPEKENCHAIKHAKKDYPSLILEGHTDAVTCVSWSNANYALSGSADTTLRLWDLHDRENGRSIRLDGHARPITAVDCSPDGTCAVSGDTEGSVRFWDLRNKQKITSAILLNHTGTPIKAISWNATSSRVLISYGDCFKIFHIDACREDSSQDILMLNTTISTLCTEFKSVLASLPNQDEKYISELRKLFFTFYVTGKKATSGTYNKTDEKMLAAGLRTLGTFVHRVEGAGKGLPLPFRALTLSLYHIVWEKVTETSMACKQIAKQS